MPAGAFLFVKKHLKYVCFLKNTVPQRHVGALGAPLGALWAAWGALWALKGVPGYPSHPKHQFQLNLEGSGPSKLPQKAAKVNIIADLGPKGILNGSYMGAVGPKCDI